MEAVPTYPHNKGAGLRFLSVLFALIMFHMLAYVQIAKSLSVVVRAVGYSALSLTASFDASAAWQGGLDQRCVT